jgi:hypothetical protein
VHLGTCAGQVHIIHTQYAYPDSNPPPKGHMYIPRTHFATVMARAGKHAVAAVAVYTCKHSAPLVSGHHSLSLRARLSRGLGHISSAHASEIHMHTDRRLVVTRPECHSSL